jgi:putative hydrolase of the HAD superfamily
MSAKKVIVFDLDGVLMDTGRLFGDALTKFVGRIYEMFDGRFSKEEITLAQHRIDMGMLYEIDPETGHPYYYRKSRFPLSFVRTYKYFCEMAGVKKSKAIASELKLIGREVYSKARYKDLVFPEVLPLFQLLKKNDFLVFILTKGDVKVQGAKDHVLKEMGISGFYKKFVIVPDDKSEAIAKIKAEHPADEYYCVGDTYKEDVLVGMKVGYFGFYKPYPLNWKEVGKFDLIESERDKKNSVRIGTVADIGEYLRLK